MTKHAYINHFKNQLIKPHQNIQWFQYQPITLFEAKRTKQLSPNTSVHLFPTHRKNSFPRLLQHPLTCSQEGCDLWYMQKKPQQTSWKRGFV